MVVQNEESIFDDIMESIGNSGRFQKRFNFIFNFVLVFFASMPYMNIIYAIVVPDHWCHVPGREFTNFSVDEWKEITLPRKNDTMARNSHEQCRMYDFSVNSNNETVVNDNAIIDCQFGWEYDQQWYRSTAPSQENWVCDKQLNVANALAVGKIGEVIGTLLFGQLGDRYGRKRVFFTTIVVITIGRSLLTVTSSQLSWFLLMMFIGSSTSNAVFISPLIIAMEISRNEDRALIAMLQCISWTIALCFMPLLMWLVQDWVPFMLITTLPCVLFLFSNSLIIESPRWLASKGKVQQCIKELGKIAKVNKTEVPDDVEMKLKKISLVNEKVYGVMSLFSSWRLAKNTVLVVTGWVVTILIYLVITLNVGNLGGNPFLNFFWQGFAELPAYIVGKYCCDYIGRRWTSIMALVLCFCGSAPMMFTINDPSYEMVTTSLAVFLKFTIALAFYSIQLQALEIYPTCVRQSGQALGAVISNSAAALGPYIVYLGTSVNASHPYIIFMISSLVGIVSCFFLPETLNMKLPESLAEARVFGVDQKYFSIGATTSYMPANVEDPPDSPEKK